VQMCSKFVDPALGAAMGMNLGVIIRQLINLYLSRVEWMVPLGYSSVRPSIRRCISRALDRLGSYRHSA